MCHAPWISRAIYVERREESEWRWPWELQTTYYHIARNCKCAICVLKLSHTHSKATHNNCVYIHAQWNIQSGVQVAVLIATMSVPYSPFHHHYHSHTVTNLILLPWSPFPSPPLFLSVSPSFLLSNQCVNESDDVCNQDCNTPQCPFDSKDCDSRKYVSGCRLMCIYYSTSASMYTAFHPSFIISHSFLSYASLSVTSLAQFPFSIAFPPSLPSLP